jgi:LuxR family maltose regulon positive regulatory protein
LAGEILAIRANVALNSNRLPEAITLGQEALAVLPAEQKRMRGEVMMHMGLAQLWSSHYEQAAANFIEAARQSEAAGDLYTALLSHSNHGTLFYVIGQLRRAAAKFGDVLELAAHYKVSQMPMTSVAYQPLAELNYEWNDLATAEAFATQAIERSLRSGNPRILLLCYVIQARIQSAQGKVEQARATIALARRLVEERALPRRYSNDVNTLEVKFWLKVGEAERAIEWMASTGLRWDDAELAGKEGQYRLIARVLRVQGRREGALDLTQRLYKSAQKSGKSLSIIETLALTSVLEMELGRESAALATLQQALSLAEPEGYMRTFLDEGAQMGSALRLLVRAYRQESPGRAGLEAYAARLLAAWQGETAMEIEAEPEVGEELRPPAAKATIKPEGVQPLIEPLSERELEVLQLVAAGLSDRQVAEQLVIVPGTVKRHLNSLYGKLGVHSRTQAIARARQLSLIKNVGLL